MKERENEERNRETKIFERKPRGTEKEKERKREKESKKRRERKNGGKDKGGRKGQKKRCP